MEANLPSITFTTKKFFCFLLLYVMNVFSITACIDEKIMTKTLAQTFPVAVVIEAGLPDSITGKFETLGSNFSQETARATGVRYYI